MRVQTVVGEIDSANLGRTLVHEHLFAKWPGAEFYPPIQVDRSWLVEQCVKRLGAIKDFGVRTFVDPCPIELGRDVGLMAEVSRRVGMNIVCTTGFYLRVWGFPSTGERCLRSRSPTSMSRRSSTACRGAACAPAQSNARPALSADGDRGEVSRGGFYRA
jgi:hypothetical protein